MGVALKKKVSVSEFKAKSLGLFEEVSKTGLEVLVTKRGEPIAVVVPIKKFLKKRQPGSLAGTFVAEEDIISPIEVDWDVQK